MFEESQYSERRWIVSIIIGVLIPPVGIILLPYMAGNDLGNNLKESFDEIDSIEINKN